MKKIICAALLMISVYAKAGSCAAKANGNWESASTWTCGHVPVAGDDVSIGASYTVTVTGNNTVNIGNLDIFGTLDFTNGSKINLASNSIVNIYSTGSIGGGNPGAKLVFASGSTYTGPFNATGPYYYSKNGQGSGILPLTLTSFYSNVQNQEVVLHWVTENEENILSFGIESSSDGNSEWEPLQTIPSMANEGGGYSYTYIDWTKINGNKYYRLKINELQGRYSYSKVLFFNSNQASTISITPTIVSNSINVSMPQSGLSQISIFNTTGQLVKTMSAGAESYSVDVSRLNRGEYFIKALQGNNSFVTKFIKQ